MLIALEGIDGSGKSTLSKAVARRLATHSLRRISNKEMPQDFDTGMRVMRSLADLLWPKQHTFDDHLFPVEYWLYLQVTWYSLLSHLIVQPQIDSGANLLTDGWYFKFIAKMLHRKIDLGYLRSIFAHVIKPDLVVLLDPEVDYVWDRKQDFKPHEMGLHQGYPTLGKESFVEYQSELRECFRLAADETFLLLPIPRGESVEASALRVSEHIKGFLRNVRAQQPHQPSS